MTDNQIKEQLNTEYEKLLYSTYKGIKPMPKGILELFKKAILALPSFAHKINFTRVKNIVTTKEENLTYSDLNEIIKVVLNVPLEKLYENADQKSFLAICKKCSEMDAFVISYNEEIKMFQNSISEKSARLTAFSSGGSGMKIIKAQA